MSLLYNNLALRVATALVVLPIVLTLIWVPALDVGFAVLVGFIALTTLHEFLNLLRQRGIPTHEPASMLGALAIIAAAEWGDSPAHLGAGLLAACIAAGLAGLISTLPSAGGMAGAFGALFYTVWCPAHVLLLHHFTPEGPGFVMLLAVCVVLTDTAAYFTGKAIGKHPLAPVVSPKKTWEGAIGGFLGAVTGALAIHWLARRYGWSVYPDWSAARYALTGAALSAVAQLSDLVKSAVKRDAGVKDSGQLLPGHGGALDRFDGFLFAAPVLYYLFVL